jgi:HSP20 family protein
MRLGTFTNGRSDVDDLFGRVFGLETPAAWGSGGYRVPTDVFHSDDRLVIRMDLPGVRADDVDVTVQEGTLIVNGKRSFPHGANEIRFMRRGIFYGDFTQRVALGKGLDVDRISASYDNGVLELTIPYSEEVQPRKIEIDFNGAQKSLGA